jgi:hypothetical protein
MRRICECRKQDTLTSFTFVKGRTEMSTVGKDTADKIVAGEFKGDRPTRIVKYQNIFNGGDAYGVTFDKQDKDTYLFAGACLNPQIYWDVEDGYGKARL